MKSITNLNSLKVHCDPNLNVEYDLLTSKNLMIIFFTIWGVKLAMLNSNFLVTCKPTVNWSLDIIIKYSKKL